MYRFQAYHWLTGELFECLEWSAQALTSRMHRVLLNCLQFNMDNADVAVMDGILYKNGECVARYTYYGNNTYSLLLPATGKYCLVGSFPEEDDLYD